MLAIDLSGRIALVTASSRGIGRAIAMYLARAGAKVVVTWAADRAAGEDAVAEIARAGGTAMLEHLDVTDSAEVDAVVARPPTVGHQVIVPLAEDVTRLNFLPLWKRTQGS